MLSFGVGIAVGVAVTLCIALLVVFALMRWRRQRLPGAAAACSGGGAKADMHQEMEWDNSTFNITVNPLDRESGFDEDVEHFEGRRGLPPPALDDDEEEEEEYPCSADELDVETAVTSAGGKSGCKELEWDDSTLSY